MNAYHEKKKHDSEDYCHYSVKRYSKVNKNTLFSSHYSDCIEVLYGLKGSVEVELTDSSYIIEQGDMLVVFSDEINKVSTLSKNENEFAMIKYDPEILYSTSQSAAETRFLNAFASSAFINNHFFRKSMLNTTKIPTIIDEILEENETGAFGSEIAIRLGLCQLALWILRSWKIQDENNTLSQINDIDIICTLQKILDYVEQNYMNKMKVENIAAHLNMSYYAFSKFFINHMGKPFTRYLDEVRLTKSKILLTTTGMNITEIALEVGFSSSSHYIQRFKEDNLMTPRQFRQEFIK